MANPILRAVKNSRATVDEKLEAYRYIRDLDPDVRHFIETNPDAPEGAKLVALSDTIEAAEALLLQGDEIRGLKTGYKQLDEMTRGLNPSEILVLFADTGVGKSQVAQNIALNLAVRGDAVLFIGLEMSNTENTVRFMQMFGNEGGFEALPILYPQTNDLKYTDIDAVVAAAKQENVKLVVLDHLHMFDTEGPNTADGIERICRTLKRTTSKYEVPLILISHTNRGSDGMAPPQLRDLKGSSAIEQIADIAITLWKHPDANPATAPLKVILRKQRKGWKRDSMELHPVGNARLAEMVEVSGAFPTHR